jgi:hypothetical protein
MGTTVKQVNAAIVRAGMSEIELFKGDGYFYFMGENCDARQAGVYVNALSCLSVEQWIGEARARYVEGFEKGADR